MIVHDRSTASTVDSHLNVVLPLLPFLSDLHLSYSIQLSRRTMVSLSSRDGSPNLRRLTGVRHGEITNGSGEDPLTTAVAQLSGLQELEIIGYGAEMSDSLAGAAMDHPQLLPQPLTLTRLRSLRIVGISASSLLDRLVVSSLPSLRNIVVTPYGEHSPPQSFINALLDAHCDTVDSVTFHTPQSWPVSRFLPPRALFNSLPNLKALSIETSSFVFDPPSTDMFPRGHPLTTISISRPTAALREEFFRFLHHLPNLREVKAREVRWAKKGMSDRAREAGFQGEMLAWKRQLNLKRIQMLDADGLPEPKL